MEQGVFCFLSDEYYKAFPDKYLMKNKETIGNISHKRPCFFAFRDSENEAILWLIPVSSKVDKYKEIYSKKLQKYGYCNTIFFAELIGKEAAFLIQNICPTIEAYITEVYFDKNNAVISIDNRKKEQIIKMAKEIVAKVKKGSRIVFPDVMKIYSALNVQLSKSEIVPEKKKKCNTPIR